MSALERGYKGGDMTESLGLAIERIKSGRITVVFLIACIAAGLAGCAPVKECVCGFAGVSTRILEDTRAEALSMTIKFDYDTAVSKVKEALRLMEAYIYAQDQQKGLIAIYVTEQDTTPVGLFFTAVDENNTRIEVSSPSSSAKELIAREVFAFLEGKPLKKRTSPEI